MLKSCIYYIQGLTDEEGNSTSLRLGRLKGMRWKLGKIEVTGQEKIGEGVRLTLFPRLSLLFLGLTILIRSLSAGPEMVRLGMSTALSGPAADLGWNMSVGVTACVERVNRSGGANGRLLHLEALDDGYEPTRTAPNMRTLIQDSKVDLIIGNVGTPTAIAAIPIVMRERVPFFAAFTGAGVLRKQPPDRYVINFRASYAEEAAAMVDALIEHVGLQPEEIGFFTQRDGYGDAGFAGGMQALNRHSPENEGKVVHSRYERNTLAVENALADMLLAETLPRAVIMVGSYAPCAKFIRLARENGLDALFLNVSFVGSESLARELGRDGEGVVITQVVPHYASDLPLIEDYRTDLARLDPEVSPSFGSLEGYIATRILCLALETLEGKPDRESITQALLSLGDFDIGLGVPLRLTEYEHQACHTVWPTILSSDEIIPLEWESLE